jgi:hypothetical protein
VADAGQGNCSGSLPARGSGDVRTAVVGRGVALPDTEPVRTTASARS